MTSKSVKLSYADGEYITKFTLKQLNTDTHQMTLTRKVGDDAYQDQHFFLNADDMIELEKTISEYNGAFL